MDYGFWSVLPILTVLIVAIATKRTLLALTCGTVVGAFLLAKLKIFSTWFDFLYQSFADPDAEWLIMVTVLFGVLVMLLERSGAVDEFAVWARRFAKGKKRTLLLTYILGFVVFLDDYLNNLVVGTAMKPMTDRNRIPRTELSYVVNGTAAPVCLLIPISTWAVFFGTLLEGQGITYNGTGIGAYIHSLPLVFYGWISLIIVLLVILGVFPLIGPMKKHALEADRTGRVFPLGEKYDTLNKDVLDRINEESESADHKASPVKFILPIIVMIIVTIVCGIDVMSGTAAGIATMVILLLIERKMKVAKILEAIFDGVVSMAFVAILVLLAYMMQKMNTELGLAEYVISVVEPLMKGALLPAVVFVFCAIYAYCTGCFWDLAAIITPIVIPLAIAMDVDPILAAAAIFSGAGFGSNTCLYGDSMILVSKSTDMQPVDNMLATLPFASIAGGLTIIGYLITGFIMC